MPSRYGPAPCPVNDSLAKGRAQFATAWRHWVAQWTQSEWLNLTTAYHGAKILHSSQYVAFSTGALVEPGPKAFVAGGYFNTALARCAGWGDSRIEAVADIGLPRWLPGKLERLWGGRDPLCDAEGVALGPSGLYMAFCGLRPLFAPYATTVTPQTAEAASRALGRALRAHYTKAGVDFVEKMPELTAGLPALEDLLLGNPLSAGTLMEAIPAIAEAAQLSEMDLWRAIEPALN